MWSDVEELSHIHTCVCDLTPPKTIAVIFLSLFLRIRELFRFKLVN